MIFMAAFNSKEEKELVMLKRKLKENQDEKNDLKTFCENNIKYYNKQVKYYEEQRRLINDKNNFYYNSYQTTIHKYNAKIEVYHDIINFITN